MSTCPKPKLPAVQAIRESVDNEQHKLRKAWNYEMGQTTMPVKYDKTSVLMLSWDPNDDDLGVAEEVETLAKVLRDEEHYNFTVITRTLNTIKSTPQAQACRHLAEFVEEQDEDRALLIVYYAGHGGEASASGSIKLSGKVPGPSINWGYVESNLADTRSDVFIIFDCCHAGLLCKPAYRDDTRCFQYLGACGAEQRTHGPSEKSFTTAMTWAFRQLKMRGGGFYVNELAALVQKAPNFPQNQFPPLYSSRFEPAHENIFLAPMPKDGKQIPQAVGEYRDEREAKVNIHPFVDLRFSFDKLITEPQLRLVAYRMKGWVREHYNTLSCQEISFLRSVSKKEQLASKWFSTVDAVRRRAISQSSPLSPVMAFADPALEANVQNVPSEITPLLRTSSKASEGEAFSRGSAKQGVIYHIKAALSSLWHQTVDFFGKCTKMGC